MKRSPKNPLALLKRLAVTRGNEFCLRDHSPDATPREVDAAAALSLLADGTVRLSALQEMLFAQGTWPLLCLFPAMDPADKNSTIKHVMSEVNLQGVRVHAFKLPGPEELAHDFLGGRAANYRRAVRSGFSTRATLEKYWWAARTLKSSQSSLCPASATAIISGGT